MPFLERALDPEQMQPQLARLLAGGSPSARVRLRNVRLVRHKPGRRFLVEYELDVAAAGEAERRVALLGKSRARGLDTRTFRTTGALYEAGFDASAFDGVCVPRPVGVLPELSMWLQEKAPGEAAWKGLLGPDGPSLARRIAEAVHKLHRSGVATRRQHGMAEEMAILRDRLARVAQQRSAWARRLERLLAACERVAASVPEPDPTGVHRDFYPDQVLVDGQRITLLDLDLYSAGDPALDVGNFAAHLIEFSLRTSRDPAALSACEEALEERFLDLAGPGRRAAVRAYADLTLARHVFISTQFEDRIPFTGEILALCESRLDAAGTVGL
jgi:hypothetical protein